MTNNTPNYNIDLVDSSDFHKNSTEEIKYQTK